MKNIKFNISNFNKYLIFIIIFLFLYLFYLSIPSLYNKDKLQNILTKKILKEFNINLSSSSDISYSILPYPHISIKDLKFFENNFVTPNELGQIKELKIFISQKNFFNQEDIEIKDIQINNANFTFKNDNIKHYKEIIENESLKKSLSIKKSNFFYKDNNDKIINITPISEITLFHNNKKKRNEMKIKGEIYTIPFNHKWTKNFLNDQSVISELKLKKLNLNIKNISSKKNNYLERTNYITLNKLELITDYIIKDNQITIKSKKGDKLYQNIDYEGLINIDPFDLQLNINLNQIDIFKVFSLMSIFEELLNLDLIYNKNLNAKVSLNSKNISKNKLFNSLIFFVNFNNGNINIDQTKLNNDKIGDLEILNSSFEKINNELVFNSYFNFNIIDQIEFYRLFQITKKNRKNLKNIEFDIEYNFFLKKMILNDLKINTMNKNDNITDQEKIDEIIENFNLNYYQETINWVDIKNLTKEIFKNYSG